MVKSPTVPPTLAAFPLPSTCGRVVLVVLPFWPLRPPPPTHNFFRSGVEQEFLWNPKRPSHQFDLSFAVFVEENNWLDRIGSNVLPRLEVDLFKTDAGRKGVCDALLIGTTTIASTHGCILFGGRH
jgi:hypothetical protein